MSRGYISCKDMLKKLMDSIEEKKPRDSFTKIVVNKEKGRYLGFLGYAIKDTNQTVGRRIFLVNITRDENDEDIIYDETGRVIATIDYENDKNGELKIPEDIALDVTTLKRQLKLNRENELEKEENDGSADDKSKAGDGI